ncbi:MAG: hypothetical protein V1704_04625 [Candidatus Vogelbacteria bacterium]
MQKLKDFSRIVIIALVVGLGVGYVLADWTVPGGPPPTGNCTDADPNCSNTQTPINVGGNPNLQTKDGNLTIDGDLTARNFYAAMSTDPNSVQKVSIGPAAFTTPRSSTNPAILDVDGQIRIRGGCLNGECQKKVLVSDSFGLAQWGTLPSSMKLKEGFGIDLGYYDPVAPTLDYSPLDYPPSGIVLGENSSGLISVWTGDLLNNPGTNKNSPTNPGFPDPIQRRITGTGTPIQAITAVTPSGAATFSNFVTTVTANGTSGLTLKDSFGTTWATATSGPISLAVNVGPTTGNTSGLSIAADNTVKLNIKHTTGSTNWGEGLRIDTIAWTDGSDADGRVKFENCGSMQTWQYYNNAWNCVNFPTGPTGAPGESVMYLRTKNLVNLYPTDCPASWNAVPINTTGSTYTGDENVGHATNLNRIRACYRSDKNCQVIYFKSTSATAPAPASCPVGPPAWTQATSSTEWAPGGTLTNYVRTCYLCN